MKKTLLVALCLLFGLLSAHAVTVNYTADNTTIFPNPERGYLTQFTRHANGSYNAVKGKEYNFPSHVDDKGTLILVLYYLDEFNQTAELPQAVFDAFEEDMQILRNYGMKAIFRIAYAENGYGDDKTEIKRSAHDAPLHIIEKHLAQYKPYWEANADVIFTFQAGFVGQYGEWYYTENFGNHVSKINDSCKALLDTALKAIPQNRTLLLRRPMFKQQYMDSLGVSSDALTEGEAYTGTPKARLGHFNDAFLYDADNMGTYSTNETKRAAQKALIAQETLYVPRGGDTDITDPDKAAVWASYEASTTEMSTMHWTFIKSGYSEVVTRDLWRVNHTFDTLNMYMGYRYQLLNATLPAAATIGNEVNIAMNIKNVGYAPLYNERHAYLVFKNATDSFAIQLDTDPRRWLPNGEIAAINEDITIPNDAPIGTYHLYLNLPDAYASLAHDPRYSVRFANEDVWDAESGMNDLGAAIEIFASTPPPTPQTESVELPATLDKLNYTACSDDLTMYNTDYFNLGPTDAPNMDRWIEWQVDIKYATEYTISEESYCKNGHTFALELYDGLTKVASYTTVDKHWGIGVQNYTQDTKWDLSGITPKVYTLRVHNATNYGQPKLKSLTLDCAIPAPAVNLPGTLNKENVATYSDDMTWYGDDDEYFDYEVSPTGSNKSRWAEWRVNLEYPGKYIVSEVMASVYTTFLLGHGWQLKLLSEGRDSISAYRTPNIWEEGALEYSTPWNLENVPAGIYLLRVTNEVSGARPKLKSLTLNYNGEIPTGIETQAIEIKTQAYDLLGRPVDASYHGIVIQNGKKKIQ